MAILEIKGLKKSFGGLIAVAGIDLEVEEGHIHSIIGPNGAGKSTLFNLISGYYPSDGGRVFFRDQEITGKKPYQIVRLGIGFVPENRWIFSELTVRENLELGHRKRERGAMASALEKVYGLFPKLKILENHLGGTLSGGEQQMLTVGRTLMGSPELILLDEPTAGLAPIVAQLLGEQIRRLKEERYTLLLAEQNALFAMDISDRAYVVDKGSVVYEGRVEDLSLNRELMREYLGV